MDWAKLKAFANIKLNVGNIKISPFDRVENIVGKGENAGYQHFLLFSQCFFKPFLLGVIKSLDCMVKNKKILCKKKKRVLKLAVCCTVALIDVLVCVSSYLSACLFV